MSLTGDVGLPTWTATALEGFRHWAGMVISGNRSLVPVSANVKKNMIAVRARLDRQSPSSIQNQRENGVKP